jgi:HSP20 family molecular chaperone IbpA
MPQLDVQKVPSAEDRSLPVFAELDRLADRIRIQAYNLFARRGAGEGRALDDWLAAEREICWPAAKLSERDGAFALEVALAGFEAGEIVVTATPQEIIVKAAHEHAKKSDSDTGDKLRWSEFRSDSVLRRVELPSAVDVNKITASFKNGLLTITAPQVEKAKAAATSIPVTAGS